MTTLSKQATTIPKDQRDIWERCFHPSGTFVRFEEEEIEQSIQDRFEQLVVTYPDNLAVTNDEEELTYNQLNLVANRLARAILERSEDGDDRIVVLLDQGPQAVAGILGVLKAGRTFVLLDPSSPSGRTGYMVDEVQPRVILSNAPFLARAEELAPPGCEVVDLDKLDNGESSENLGLSISPDAIAYIAYTSGSTGQPKGVLNTHRAALHAVMEFTNLLHICSSDRLSLVYSSDGAAGLRDGFRALLNGAAVCQFDIKREGVRPLGDWLNRSGVTIWHSSPTVFRHFTASLTGTENFPNLRVLHTSGEPVLRSDLNWFSQHFPSDCILANVMGSTEAPAYRWYLIDHNTEARGPTLPSGYNFSTEPAVLLVDEKVREVGPNEVGQIVVRSRYLSPGYWRRPHLTKTFFSDGPVEGDARLYRTGDIGRLLSDGCLYHLGRMDSQFKIRGYRVEVAEIETVLLDLDAVKAAAVTVTDDVLDGQRLVAHIVPSEQPAPTVTELRNLLLEKLPEYMVPSSFVVLDAVPLLPNGKVDRRALRAPGPGRPNLGNRMVAPRTRAEQEVVKIWSEVLRLDEVGIHDDFRELGGHSLLATQVVSRVISTFQVDVPLRTIFEAPTVADMALAIVQYQAKDVDPDRIESLLSELEGLSDDQARQAVDLRPA